MFIDVMLSREEISFREEFKAFLDRLDLSFILRMDKEDEGDYRLYRRTETRRTGGGAV